MLTMEDIVCGYEVCGDVRVKVVGDAAVTFGSVVELGMCQDGLMSTDSKRCALGVVKNSIGYV